MRFSTKLVPVFAVVIMLFNSCKNELNILAPYRETVSVYAILDPTQNRNYIRINRIFLGEGDAFVMATVQDSTNYGPGILRVTLTRTFGGLVAGTTIGDPLKTEIVLSDTVIQLKSGPFNTNQRLWFTNDKLYTDGEYTLKIQNTKTGNEFTSTCSMIGPILTPGIIQPLGPKYYPVAYSPTNIPSDYLDLSSPTAPRSVTFYSLPKARDYSCIIRMHYVDYCNISGTDSIKQTIDYEFSRISSTNLDGGEKLAFTYTSANYFNFIYLELTKKGNPPNFLKRRLEYIEYILTNATQEYADFIKVNAPSTSIAQDKPTYSNISNGGYGIFSCRANFYAPKHPHANTYDYLATTAPYCNLVFMKSDGTVFAGTCN